VDTDVVADDGECVGVVGMAVLDSKSGEWGCGCVEVEVVDDASSVCVCVCVCMCVCVAAEAEEEGSIAGKKGTP